MIFVTTRVSRQLGVIRARTATGRAATRAALSACPARAARRGRGEGGKAALAAACSAGSAARAAWATRRRDRRRRRLPVVPRGPAGAWTRATGRVVVPMIGRLRDDACTRMVSSMAGRFATIAGWFPAFLGRTAVLTRGCRFVARNFLLDEGVPVGRASAYLNQLGGPCESMDRWSEEHDRYLTERVQTTTEGGSETFRPGFARAVESDLDQGIDLIHVAASSSVTRSVGADHAKFEELLDWFAASASADGDLRRYALDGILRTWSTRRPPMPVFSTFWECVRELLEPAQDQEVQDWSDSLQNLLGLQHFPAGSRMLVFRYSVKLVRATAKGWANPFSVPTVLDGRFHEAFCPAPREAQEGRAVDLRARLEQPAIEVLHPPLELGLQHLFRVSPRLDVRPSDVSAAREAHLLQLRDMFSRQDYALDTEAANS